MSTSSSYPGPPSDQAQPRHPEESDSTSPWVWVAIVSVVLIAAAVVIWLVAGSDDDTSVAPPTEQAQDSDNGSVATEDPTGQDTPAETDDAATTDPEDSGSEDPDGTADPTETETGTGTPTSETESDALGDNAPEQARRDPGDPMALGEVDAPVVLIEYADFRCPYCIRWAREVKPELMEVVEDGTLRIEFRDFPVLGEESELVAAAGRAAAEQNLFWEFYDALAQDAPETGHPDLPRARLLEIAEEIGMPDLAQFEADLDDPEIAAAIEADRQEALDAGFGGTPAFLINSQSVGGFTDAPVFLQIIDAEAAAAGQGGA